MEGQLKNGTIFTSESRNKYTVVNLLGAGGQGEVYDVECDGKHYALKWYFKGSATARQKKLLEEIIAKGAPDSSFLWPMELIVPCRELVWIYHAASSRNYREHSGFDRRIVLNPIIFMSYAGPHLILLKGYRESTYCRGKVSGYFIWKSFFNPDNGDVLICDNDKCIILATASQEEFLVTPGFYGT